HDVTERRRAEDAARSSEERLRLLFELSRDSIVLTSDSGDIVDVNPAGARLLGAPTDKLIGANVRDITVPSAAPRADRQLAKSPGGAEELGELHFLREDGMERIAEFTNQSIGPNLRLYILRDITERKQAENRERAHNQRGRLHFEQTPLGVIDWDVEFRVKAWNPAAERIFGYTRQEAMGHHGCDLLVPESAKAHVDRVWENLLTTRGGLRSTNENVTKDGRVILCEWYNTTLIDADGKVVAVASLVQDVTEPRRAQRALEQSEQKFRMLADSSVDLVSLHDLEGRFLYASPSWKAQSGYDAGELLGRDAYELIHPDDRQRVMTTSHLPLLKGQDTVVQWRLVHKQGLAHWMETRSTLVCDETGQPVRILCATRDISQRKIAEDELRGRGEQLEQLLVEHMGRIAELEQHRVDKEKLLAEGRQAADLARQANEPLHAMRAVLFQMRDSVRADAHQHESISAIQAEIERVEQIMRRMSEACRLGH
ncbi:MAG: PAS domain S-box protein, partial [Tepidisphaeraceae bacterium]